MKSQFDQVIPRGGTDSLKWNRYGDGVLPLWVADMDFRAPATVLDALAARVKQGVFGYGVESPKLKEALCERIYRLQNWRVTPEMILFLPGLVCGLNVVSRAVGQTGDRVMVSSPVYPPFLSAPGNQKRELQAVELNPRSDGNRLTYPLDMDAVQSAADSRTKLFILCNPHNPTGRVYRRQELLKLAEFCLGRGIVLCSDEIHCDLLLDDDLPHVAVGALDAEVAKSTVTLVAPSKTFNIPGLGCSMAIVPDPALREQVLRAAAGIVPEVNVLGIEAALAAYESGGPWLEELLTYLRGNRDCFADYAGKHWPQLKWTVPEATYLAWLDCRSMGLGMAPYRFFLEHAGVALNDGRRFGPGGDGFVRLNFGCPRATLELALEQMNSALTRVGNGD